jgi:hypothetical protein
MIRAKPFSHLLQEMTPERRAKIEAKVQLALLHMALSERQKSLGYTSIGIDLSELENLEDISVSRLYEYIHALGGELKLVANFPNEDNKNYSPNLG